MKTSLLLLLSLFLGIIAVHEASPPSGFNISKFYDELNRRRVKLATAYNIGNMWKLKRDVILEYKSKLIAAKGCHVAVVGNGFRAFPYGGNKPAFLYNQFISRFLSEWEKKDLKVGLKALKLMEASSAFGEELMHPLQKRVGCAETEKCQGSYVDPVSNKNMTVKWSYVCLVGPETKLLANKQSGRSYVYRGVKHGAVGSNCEHGVSDQQGLCV
ncbi:unnamed protein product [Caenorhabditis sp. 36 PRJEB53466]|nr:unnamed protein product [Caenorhabditis sp. 36 PRJEB53466]